MRWYAVYTKARMEVWALNNLQGRGFEVYLPLYARRRSHARKIEIVRAPLFPRYLFLRADLARCGRAVLNTAPGVVGLVSFGGKPAPVSDPVIEEIRRREDESGLVRLIDAKTLNPNDRVRIVRGTLCDVVGLFVRAAENDRVVLLLNLLGQQVQTHVPASTLQREF